MKILEKIVQDYSNTEKTDYALLVNGEWGSGKTFFIKNRIIPLIEKSSKCIYVSLNGISSINQIERDILVGFIGLKDQNKIVKYLSSKVSHISSFLSGVFTSNNFKIDITSINLISLFDFKNVVIVFDDLERISSKLELKEVLGFINTSFVEHKSVKVILIGNLNETPEDEIKKIKEKLIGRQILFEYSYEEIYQLVLNKYRMDTAFISILNKNKDTFISYLDEYKINNLRTIFFYFNHLQEFYKTNISMSDEVWKRIFLFSLIITIEFKNGSFIENEKEKRKALWELTNNFLLIDLIRKNDSENISEETFSEIIVRKYLTNHRYEYRYYDSIYKAIILGVFEKDLFNKEFDSTPDMPYNDALHRQNDYLILSKKEFDQNISVIYEGLEKGIYNLYTHQHIFQMLNEYSKKELIDLTVQDVKQKVISSLQIAKLREDDYDDELFDRGDFYVAKDEDSREIFSLIREFHDQHYRNQKKDFVLGILSQLSSSKSDFTKFLRNTFLINLSDFLTIVELKDKIDQASNFSITKFSRFLAEKYRYDNYDTTKDLPLINSLIELGNNIINEKETNTLRKDVFENYLRILNTIKEKLDNKATIKQNAL